MGWREHQQDWEAKLSKVKPWPLGEFRSKEPKWTTVKRWDEFPTQVEQQKRTRLSGCDPEGRLRVSFPLKFGLGLGGGGIDSTGLALRIVQVKMGFDISCWPEDSPGEQHQIRQKKLQKSARKVEKAGNTLNAATVLLLSQAFCGPVVTLAMTCMAAVEFTHFIMKQVSSAFGKEPTGPYMWTLGGLGAKVHDFSSASLLLSLGVPILKCRYPALHRTLECMGAAIPIAVGYARTTAKVKGAPVGSGVSEKLWRQCHRWAACRVSGYLSDFQHPPAIGWLADLWEQTSVIIIPNIESGKTWIIGSTPLPLRVNLNQHYKMDHSTDKIPAKNALSTPDPAVAMHIQRNHLAQLPEDEGYGQVSVSGWGESGDNLYLEFSVVQGGWRRLQQRYSLIVRGCYLVLVFGPLIVFGPVIYFMSTVIVVTWGLKIRQLLWWLLRFCLERGGAAFIKWGQWSATREDLFPEDLCRSLGRLHDRAPQHSYNETRKAVLENLGRSIEDIFEDFPQKPCASGSIAQVYRAKLKDRREGMPRDVAVKVRHPSVALRIYQDFQIMAAVANWAQELPPLRWLKLRESVDQFSHTLTAQADLRVEAENLARFHQNFENVDKVVIFPKLIPDLVSEGVIVESFECGQVLREFLMDRNVLNTQIAATGVDTYLKMLLTDNFVHTDLHPGNIMARNSDDGQGLRQKLQLVLLDFGLAEELTPTVRYHFISLMLMMGAGNGKRAAHHLLNFSWPHEQTCKNPQLLVEDMEYLFAQECNIQQSPIDLNKVLIKILQLCRKHEVTIDSSYASLVVAVCVLVGFAKSLDPDMSIMDAAVPCLFLYNLTGRILGRIYG